MAQSLSKFYVHIVFSTKYRNNTTDPRIETELYKVMAGKIKTLNGMSILINGTSNHIHILTLFPGTISMSNFIREIKTGSTKWIRKKDYRYREFSWQNGYAAFSVGESGVKILKTYIERQKQHHAKIQFKKVLIGWLTKYELSYNEEYLWD